MQRDKLTTLHRMSARTRTRSTFLRPYVLFQTLALCAQLINLLASRRCGGVRSGFIIGNREATVWREDLAVFIFEEGYVNLMTSSGAAYQTWNAEPTISSGLSANDRQGVPSWSSVLHAAQVSARSDMRWSKAWLVLQVPEYVSTFSRSGYTHAYLTRPGPACRDDAYVDRPHVLAVQ